MRENTSVGSISFPMEESAPTGRVGANLSAGHLSVRIEGAHPAELTFLFEQQEKRFGPALLVSFGYHIAMIALVVFAFRHGTGATSLSGLLPEQADKRIVWLSQPGPGGGGGGGGNRMKEPPRPVELPGKDKLTVPVMKTPKLENPQQAKDQPNPIEQLNIPAITLASGAASLPGAIDVPPGPPSASLGSGSGGGAGTGTGSGIGPGTGSGLGPGSGGGTGGGVYRPGSGVTIPRVLHEEKPQYTSDAMRAKVQGTVLLECIVRADGTVSDVKIIRSLDSIFGLDREAVNAARKWRFIPGTRMGEPVAVLVTIELTFTLR